MAEQVQSSYLRAPRNWAQFPLPSPGSTGYLNPNQPIQPIHLETEWQVKQIHNFPGKYPFVINAESCTAVLVSPNFAIGVAHFCYNKLLVGAHNISKAEVTREEFEVVEKVFATGKRIPRKFVYGENNYDITK